jgi:hypothetical protein
MRNISYRKSGFVVYIMASIDERGNIEDVLIKKIYILMFSLHNYNGIIAR